MARAFDTAASQSAVCSKGIQIPTSSERGHSAVGGGGGDLTDGLGTAVARDEHTGDGGLGEATLPPV